MAQLPIGALRAAEANLRRSIALCREIKDEFKEAIGHQELGRLLAYRGAYAESETELATALEMFEKQKHVQGQGSPGPTAPCANCSGCASVTDRCGRASLQIFSEIWPDFRNPPSPPLAARWNWRTRRPARDYPVERDYVRAHWLLGAAHRVAGQPDEAERHLHEALERCRRINMVDHEADILIDLARLRAATGAADEARRLADEALLIADRSGYVLQAADAHLELANWPWPAATAPPPASTPPQAHRLATCDGPPDYTYAAAYAEAEWLLARLP